MFDKASNKFYYEVRENNSPETINKTRAALDFIGKNDLCEETAVQMLRDVQLSVLSNCVSVSKHTDVTQMTNAINGINDIIKGLGDACELLTGGITLYHESPEAGGESKLVGFTDDEYEDEIYDIVDGARDKLFAARQTVIELCSE